MLAFLAGFSLSYRWLELGTIKKILLLLNEMMRLR